jgi:hypothetical protein
MGFLMAGLALAPVSSMRAAVRECVAGKPTAQSYTWNFQNEAAQLLQRVRDDALTARHQAAVLESVTDETDIGWQFYADHLTRIRNRVDDMGKAICRLETIRRVTSPQEQKVIDSTIPFAQSMAANADAAIVHLNNNQMDYWQPVYRTYTANLYRDARKISNTIGSFESHYES